MSSETPHTGWLVPVTMGRIGWAVVILLITLAGLWPVLWRNGFGSDELEHYTAKYTWQSNQTAHLMMGFCFMTLFWWGCVRRRRKPDASVTIEANPIRKLAGWFRARPVLWPFAAILVKDFVFDVLKDLLATACSPIWPNWSSLYFDAITDDLFWFTGFGFALFVIGWRASGRVNWKCALGLFVGFLLGALGCGGFWTAQKDSFDRSGLPLNYKRLTHVAGEVRLVGDRDTAKSTMRRIQTEAQAGRPVHIVIFGGAPGPRTELAVAIGCEYVFRLDDWRWSGSTTVLHSSAVHLLEDPGRVWAVDSPSRCLVVIGLDTATVPPIDALVESAIAAKKPELVSVGIRNQLDLARFFALKGHPKAELYKKDVPLDEDALRFLQTTYIPDPDPERSLPDIEDRILRVRSAVQTRSTPFRTLGAAAREKGIATVWSLAETPTWLGHHCTPAEEAIHRANDREAWIHSLAYLLGIKPDGFIRLELEAP